MRRNLSTTLPCRTAPGGMRDFDRLPAPLRAWLHQAALPWSERSALRIWRKARAEGRCAVAHLAAIEAAMLARERPGPAVSPVVPRAKAPPAQQAIHAR